MKCEVKSGLYDKRCENEADKKVVILTPKGEHEAKMCHKCLTSLNSSAFLGNGISIVSIWNI